MKQILPRLILLFLFGLISIEVSATHNRAGEIRVEQLGDDCNSLNIRATVTTYTKTSSGNADRDSVTVCWDEIAPDGMPLCEKIPRTSTTVLANDIQKNVYEGLHTYAGRGRYKISMTDPNRIANIVNINNSTSVMVPFYIETVFTFLDPQFQGCNSTPELLQPPIDIGCIGQEFRHNPNAFDPDGDSISYHLVVPLQAEGEPVPNYRFPDQVVPGGNIRINPVNGNLIWSTPQRAGDYNIAIMIIEHRGGVAIDTTIRDLQVEILDCENMPPEIKVIREICVVAGETVEFDVEATAPIEDSRQMVSMQAFGGPLAIKYPGTFTVDSGFQQQPLVGKFRWETRCEHISEQYYSVVFRAEDDFPLPGGAFLSTLETVRIKVVGPEPKDLQAEAFPGEVKLDWLSPYVCEDAEEDYFFGFAVYRRLGSRQFPRDTCAPGMGGRGYQLIEFQTRDLDINDRYIYSDTDVERGRTYCYRLVARFARETDNGQPYNLVDGLPSDEICIQLSRDIPLITNVDVTATDAASGSVFVQWSKPNGADLDTMLNLPPYRYRLLRATGITDAGFTPVPGADFSSPSFATANDTFFVDNTLNTAGEPYSYKVEFFVNNEAAPVGDTEHASSVFLNIFETDERNELSWQFDVPWENITYTIYRDDDADGIFDSLAITADTAFVDEGLVNGKEYCYYIESSGSYGVRGLLDPLLNKSQRSCGTPIDNVPPCPPPLAINNICDPDAEDELIERVENRLRWQNPEMVCKETDDVLGYRIYYAMDSISTLELIAEIDFEDDTVFYHALPSSVAGCYAVTALDSLGNESDFSNVVCKDNCPSYTLPNAFTPNADSRNDIFRPFPYRFIASIDMQIVNRWGNVVFETTDPAINWDGTAPGGEELPNGVYFYKCQVFEQRLEGVVSSEEVLSGFIELIRDVK